MQPTSPERERLLRTAYARFNARDVDGALALMHSDVDWPNVMEPAVRRDRFSSRAVR